MGDIERKFMPERFKLGVFDTGSIAGVYPMSSVSGRPDMEMVECVRADVHRGAVSFTAEELHCLTCAMAGNFPEQFGPIRMDLLRKLAKASRAAGGR